MVDENSNEKNTVVMECPLSFLLKSIDGQEIMKGKARALVEKEKLSLLTDAGETLVYKLRDISKIEEKDYHLFLTFSFKGGDEILDLFFIGFKFEDFYRDLSKCRNEIILQDMLVKDKVRQGDTNCEYTLTGSAGDTNEKPKGGKCNVRILETSILIIPLQGEIIRIPMGNLMECKPEDYSISLLLDSDEKITLMRMGTLFDPFKRILAETINAFTMKTQSFLQELLPDSDSSVIRKVSSLMKEGKVAPRKKIEAISDELWEDFEARIARSPMAGEYEFLRSLGNAEKMAIGFKRGLMSGMNSDYLWFVTPILGSKPGVPGEPGNALALEAGIINTREEIPEGETDPNSDENEAASANAAEEDILKQEGKATYFFRIFDRQTYASLKDTGELDRKIDEFILAFNHCMQEINFRREPIYLSEKRLNDPKYIKYRYAIKRLPELRKLRELFIGRVFHKTPDQWRNDITSLLKFNTISQNNGEKWEKGG